MTNVQTKAVAVLVPVYKGEDPNLFDQALLSIEHQILASSEINIYLGIDGSLTTELEWVVEQHASKLHRVVRHPEHIGPSRVLNSLYHVLEDEELVFRMDSDDIALQGRLQKQCDFLRQHPDIDILGGSIEEYNVDSGKLTIRHYPTNPDNMKKAICMGNPIAHPTVCIRRRVLRATGGFPLVRNQDLALWTEALCQGFRISNLDAPLVRMTVSSDFFRRRRSFKRLWPEIALFSKAVWRLHGVTWRYIFPMARLVFRLIGPKFHSFVYASRIRNDMMARNKIAD